MSETDVIKQYILAAYVPDAAIGELDSSYDLLANGVIDSLGLLELIAWVAERYQIQMDDIEISPDHFRSVDAIRLFVERAAPCLAKDPILAEGAQ